MGINVVLRDERCNDISDTVYDPNEAINATLPNYSDVAFCCIRFIDHYGDTIFNSVQAPVLLAEWDMIRQSFKEREADVLWADIRALIVRCSQEMHTYLWFIGD